jgi:3-oxoacyl-[acyl-carrier-protein] synthase-3
LGMRVTATTLAVPPRVQTSYELAPLIHRSAEWIQEHTGVLKRHIADDHVSPSQLAAIAAREAIAISGNPDLILYAGALTQHLVPDTSAFVQRELELERIPCFTVNQTCLSFIAAMQVAHGLLKVGSYQRVLICSGELATRGRSFEEAESAALLGDGGAATIVEYSNASPSDLVHCDLETWSGGIDLCSVLAGNHPPRRSDMSHDALFCFHMQGPQLYRFVRPRLKVFLKSFLEKAGCSMEQVQLIVPHQASGPGIADSDHWRNRIRRLSCCICACRSGATRDSDRPQSLSSGWSVASQASICVFRHLRCR